MTPNTTPTTIEKLEWEKDIRLIIEAIHKCGYEMRVDCKKDGDCAGLIAYIRFLLLTQLEEVQATIELQACERYFEDNSPEAKIKRILDTLSTLKEKLKVTPKKK